MVILNACREVSAPLGRVWDIVADVVRHINAVNNISKNGNTIEREVIVPFRNSKSRQTVVINPKRSGLKIVVADGAYDSKENFRYLYDNNIEAAILSLIHI